MIKLIRYLVALTFIASAFLKGVDPKGFSFKLEEYFSPSVFNLPFLHDQALYLALVVVGLEFVLGLWLLLRIRLKITLLALITLCVFFAFLTFYSAYYKVVTDCGCFGDALKLEPWESFYKDLVLLLLLMIIFVSNARKANKNPQYWLKSSGIIKKNFFGIASFIFAYYAYKGITAEPLIDFRSYKIGANIRDEKLKIEKNPSIYKAVYVLKNKKTGQEIKMNQDEYIDKNYWKDPNLELLSDKTTSELFKQGYASSMDKFLLTKNNFDETDAVIAHPKSVLVFSYEPEKLNPKELQIIENHLIELKKQMIYVAFVSTKNDLMKTIDQFNMDGTAIKTIARSHPFVLVLENGRIVQKEKAKTYFNLK